MLRRPRLLAVAAFILAVGAPGLPAAAATAAPAAHPNAYRTLTAAVSSTTCTGVTFNGLQYCPASISGVKSVWHRTARRSAERFGYGRHQDHCDGFCAGKRALPSGTVLWRNTHHADPDPGLDWQESAPRPRRDRSVRHDNFREPDPGRVPEGFTFVGLWRLLLTETDPDLPGSSAAPRSARRRSLSSACCFTRRRSGTSCTDRRGGCRPGRRHWPDQELDRQWLPDRTRHAGA
jgi:hypothetical protein